MVPVAPKNVAARNAIRQTWAKEPYVHGKRVLTMFMLGQAGEDPQSLTQEDNEHHDLIQSDFVDSYLNLTIKTMVIMHWVSTHCANSTFAMKVDSDMFLNVENLVDMLKLPQIPTINYLTGRVMRDIRVIRAKHSKWYVPEELYPEPKYPLYCLGMGYILSSDLPVRLVEVSKEITPFNIEDAYIGMCMKKLGLSPTAPPQPGQFQAYNSKYDRCRFSQVITYILGSSQQLLQYWDDLKKPDPPCPQ
uniref:Hexosyltransferase n=1 Tax=Knipowitschia caucasica TaxID=637954 RepID=A0AAV2LKE8_KNICA